MQEIMFKYEGRKCFDSVGCQVLDQVAQGDCRI